MSDKELADKVVALGIGDTTHVDTTTYYHLPVDSGTQAEGAYGADAFVRDWRVAGLLMERCVVVEIDKGIEEYEDIGLWTVGTNYGRGENHSLPRAIIEACVTALEAA